MVGEMKFKPIENIPNSELGRVNLFRGGSRDKYWYRLGAYQGYRLAKVCIESKISYYPVVSIAFAGKVEEVHHLDRYVRLDG